MSHYYSAVSKTLGGFKKCGRGFSSVYTLKLIFVGLVFMLPYYSITTRI